MALLRSRLRRRLQRRLRSVALAVLLAASVLFLAQPPDGRTRLALRFNLSRLAGWALADRRDDWIGEAAVSTRHDHGLRLATDVGFVIKTGYGTRTRLPEQLDAFARSGGDMLGEPATGFLVVGDWSGGNASDQERLGVDVVDAVALMLDARQGGDAGLGLGYGLGQRQRQHPRLDKYRRLQAAVAAGDEQQAQVLGQAYGWELDALKFIVGLELAFRRLPAKKWYLVLDDDTFLVRPSLELLLGHLDASQPQYLGNAVGDYKARFAHGGSAVVLSAETLRRLFARPDVVADAYRCSLDETWGDRLVATTLQRVGVHIRERYSHHFNGEAPELTRLRRDRLCSPIVSFHGLRQPGAMAAVGRALAGIEHPITWGQLWHLFSPLLPMERLGRKPALPGDHVGPRDEHTRTWAGLNDEDACRRRCERTAACLAWTLDPGSGDCHVSPWALVGWPAPDGPDRPLSGVNWERIEPLMQRCPPLPT